MIVMLNALQLSSWILMFVYKQPEYQFLLPTAMLHDESEK